MDIEVVYGTAERQKLVRLQVAEDTTARAAALLSGMDTYFPGIDLAMLPLGVFGETVADDYVLVADDRLEIYRPLLVDPMEARRRRAAGK